MIPFESGYFEAERGRFDSALCRRSGMDVLEIAYTDVDSVRTGLFFDAGTDIEAVLQFAEYYDLPVEW